MAMVTVTHKGKTYRIAFEHAERDFVLPKSKSATAITEKRRVTTCSIWSQPKRVAGKVLATGESVCRPPDRFDREEGRKRALARAVVELTGPRNDERVVLPRGPLIPAWTDLVGRIRARAGMTPSQSPYVRTFVPRKGVLELRRAIWDAYFARLPMRVTVVTKLLPGKMFVKMARPPTDAELRGMMDAASASLHEGMD